MVDVQHEKDIEQLRRVALAQRAQIESLLKVLASQAAELGALKGKTDELQQTLALVEQLTKQSKQLSEELAKLPDETSNKAKKPRTKFGNTEQPTLPIVEELFELDAADKTCPSCGGDLAPMKDQFDTSEMVDVIEVSYRVVKIKQQKYTCKCGGCVETAPGPERVTAGGRYSLAFAINVAIDKYLDHSRCRAKSASSNDTGSSSPRRRFGISSTLSVVDSSLLRERYSRECSLSRSLA